MPIVEVIRSVTVSAAKAIHWDHRIGSLSIGAEADISVLRIDPVDLALEDCQAQLRNIKQVQASARYSTNCQTSMLPYNAVNDIMIQQNDEGKGRGMRREALGEKGKIREHPSGESNPKRLANS